MPNIYVRIGRNFTHPDHSIQFGCGPSIERIKRMIAEAHESFYQDRNEWGQPLHIWLKVQGQTDWMQDREIGKYMRGLTSDEPANL